MVRSWRKKFNGFVLFAYVFLSLSLCLPSLFLSLLCWLVLLGLGLVIPCMKVVDNNCSVKHILS